MPASKNTGPRKKGGNRSKAESAEKLDALRVKLVKRNPMIDAAARVIDSKTKATMKLIGQIQSAEDDAEIASALREYAKNSAEAGLLRFMASAFDPNSRTEVKFSHLLRKMKRPKLDIFRQWWRPLCLLKVAQEIGQSRMPPLERDAFRLTQTHQQMLKRRTGFSRDGMSQTHVITL